MNSNHFIMTSVVFLIEAGKYDAAAEYLLRDAYNDNGTNQGKNGKKPARNKLVSTIKQQHEFLRRQYPKSLSIEQMRELATRVYENIFQSLLSGNYPESLLQNENPGN